nr:DUF4113 domain-containing protein [Micropruina sp.]
WRPTSKRRYWPSWTWQRCVWGIGPRWAARLRALGLLTARDLRDADSKTLRQRFGVVLERIVWELRGVTCLEWAEIAPPKRQLIASRSFGRPVTALAEVQAAVAHHVARAVAALVQPGRRYQGAGVMLLELTPAARAQNDWITAGDDDRNAARWAVLDRVNARWGRGTLRLAREGFEQPWAMRQDRCSPAYTTRWADLPVARTG